MSVCVSVGEEGPSWCFELAKSRVDETRALSGHDARSERQVVQRRCGRGFAIMVLYG